MENGILGRTEVGAAGAVETRANSIEVKRTLRTRRRLPGLFGIGLGLAMLGGAAGCHSTPAQSASANPVDQNAGDPANANLAPASGNGGYAQGPPAQVLAQNAQYTSQQQGQDYGPQQQAAPIERQAPVQGAPNYDNQQAANEQAADLYASDLTDAQASDPPPELPDYEQPPAPDPNTLWTPGYWAWGQGGYYWVPGCWVAAPYTGALWTPGYWGFYGGRYRFHHGFWGLHIGFYGGIDYGYGYTGYGYYGGYWNGGNFFYNTSVNRVNVNVVRNVYVHNVVINNVVVNNRVVNRVSFNGGRGGVSAQPRPAEIAVLHEQRNAPMASQVQVEREAAQNPQQFYSANRGRPAAAVNMRPVVADRALPAALPRVAGPMPQPAVRNDARPVQTQGPVRPGEQQRVQPQPEVRQTQPQQQVRQEQPQVRQVQPETRQVQPEVRQAQPEVRQAQPQLQARPAPEARPVPQPQLRPQEQPRPQEQVRPQPAPQARPQPEARPAPQARPAPPPSHAAPASHPPAPPKDQPHPDDKPHR